MIATLYDYSTGDKLGHVEIDARHAKQYEEGVHEGYQWPEGITEAGWLLDSEEMDRLGIHHRRVVFLVV